MQPLSAARRRTAPRRLGAALALGLALLAGAPALAQVADGAIEVAVADPTGGLLPGVSVEVRNLETGLLRTATTNEAGTARVPALPPGSYSVEATIEGFSPTGIEKLALRVGQTARLSITMQAAMSEEMTVTAAAGVVDVHHSDVSTNIVPEQIESLPIADRDFQKLAFIAPGVQRERGGFRFVSGGPVIGASGNASQATILVDGVDFTDPSLGLARARISSEAVREFKVLTNRFDTEVGGSAGGALSIVTRTGTNDFDGRAFGFFRDKSLRQKSALEQEKPDYSRDQFGVAAGGPIVPDRTHFFLSFEKVGEDNVTLFRPSGTYTGLAADVKHPFDQDLGFASLDQQISTSQLLTLNYVYEKYREDNFRVGGNAAVSYGQELNRDNSNFTLGHDWTITGATVNSAHLGYGKRKYWEPTNSDAMAEWFSSGNTLRTGSNIVGDLLGDAEQWEIHDTLYTQLATGSVTHDIKGGLGWVNLSDRFDLPTYQDGLMIYLTDTRALPLAFAYGVGSADATIDTDIYSAFVQDDMKVLPNLTVNLGLRYDLDTNGNNPNFTHPLIPKKRGRDTDNYQPRIGFTWDVAESGDHVVRGGVGKFTGRFLLVPAFTELQQNGITGRQLFTRLNGALFGLPAFTLDPAHPYTTGLPQRGSITLMDDHLEAPESTQANLGYTMRLGSTGLYLDADAIYAKGEKEIVVRDTNFGGNAHPVRPNPAYTNIVTYTNEGHSKYQAFVLGVKGMLFGRHLVQGSVTWADKKNISDDFSPEFPFGYPNDPADIEAEYGPSRGDERWHVVLSGVFRLPWALTLAPIWEYGSGQPWTHRLGYDYNADGYNSDRPAGVGRNSMEGPSFNQLSLRLSKAFAMPWKDGELELIAECFNVFDTTNYNVQSLVDSGNGAEFLSGPTLANPNLPYVRNPNYGRYTSTFTPREFQLGVRVGF